jgi:hypothetical protein
MVFCATVETQFLKKKKATPNPGLVAFFKYIGDFVNF